MKKILFSFLLLSQLAFAQEKNISNQKNMELGAFSISLKVKDIKKSVEFYEKLGFTYKGGNIDQNWIVLKNGNTVIGLFQGFIEENTLTFNPGWDQQAQNLHEFTDVREIQKKLKAKDVKLDREADEKTSGPEYIILKDPDGNPILIDQHR
jgi:catechol 2,3-dioxygenase-like lactoylglutathione lyase family enzyme